MSTQAPRSAVIDRSHDNIKRMTCRGRCYTSTSMAEITDEKLDEVEKVTENGSHGLSENDGQMKDREETLTESTDPIFTDGHVRTL